MNNKGQNEDPLIQPTDESVTGGVKTGSIFAELERRILSALETYSNVHRGSGHNSMVSTHLYEKARDIVLDYLGLDKMKYTVIFCTRHGGEALRAQLKEGTYQLLSSKDFGLHLGIVALAVIKKVLPKGKPFQAGGGTTRLVAPGWIIWAKPPDRFEAGTPAIINAIAFAIALRLITHYGKDVFLNPSVEKLSAGNILYNDELELYSGQKLLDELRRKRIGMSVTVPTSKGTKLFINLDNAASTPTFGPVWNAVGKVLQQPPEVHQEMISEVRGICARFLGAPSDEYDVIFTSNTSEAINLVAGSLDGENKDATEPVVVNTVMEHNSNDLPWRFVPGTSLIRLKVSEEGFLDLNELDLVLTDYNQKGRYGRKRIRLVTISGVSNVLGLYNNLSEISRIVHHYGAQLLVDAAQMVAHRKVEIKEWNIDYLAFSAHKVYAPFGTGVLVVRKNLLNFTKTETELIRSSGEENVAGITALGKALTILERIGMDLVKRDEEILTRRVLNDLSQNSRVNVYGIKDPGSQAFAHKGGVIVFDVKGVLPARVARQLAEYGGIGVRYGCHCAHILIKYLLHVPSFFENLQGYLLRLFPSLVLPGLTRLSFGIYNMEEDISVFIRTLERIAAKKPEGQELSRKTVQTQIQDFIKAAARKVYGDD